MIFYGNGSVWDVKNKRILCEFADGELETQDERIINILKSANYPYQEDIIEKKEVAENDNSKTNTDTRSRKRKSNKSKESD